METCKDEIEGMARCDAEDSLYSEDECIVSLAAVDAIKLYANIKAA